MVKTGLDVLVEQGMAPIKGKRVGLCTNATSVTRDLRPAVDVFDESESVDLVAIYTVDHGLSAMVETGGDDFKLYGKSQAPIYNIARHGVSAAMVRGVDVLVYDTMDGGARYFANIYNMSKLMRAAAEAGVPFLVLDRPNPVNGVDVEGNVVEEGFLSHIGMFPIAMRHGMTNGEIARLFNEEFGIGCELSVLRMQGWERWMWWDDTGVPFVIPAPNLPTLTSMTLYPGTCLFEGVNMSLGRGTTRPFELLGAPWIDEKQYTAAMNELNLPGVAFRPAVFYPRFSNASHPSYVEECRGLQVYITDRNVLKPITVALHLIAVARKLYPEHFDWFRVPWLDGANYFELLTGTDKVRIALENEESVDEIVRSWKPIEDRFRETREPYLLY